MPYYRAAYHSTSGGNCPRLQALADRVGSVLVDVIIQTDEPLDDPQPVSDYLAARPDYAGFSSWDEFSPELVSVHAGSLEQKAIHFAPSTN